MSHRNYLTTKFSQCEFLRAMQDRGDPNALRHSFETDIFPLSYQRVEVIKRASGLFAKAGQEDEAITAWWDAVLYMYHQRKFNEEVKGRFGSGYVDGHEFPDPNALTDTALDYYERRAHEAANPILRSRYADFIWECRRKHKYARLAIQAYHESYLTAVEGAHRWRHAAECLERELHIVRASNDAGGRKEPADATYRWPHVADCLVRPLRIARRLQDSALVKEAKKRLIAGLDDFLASGYPTSVRYLLEPIDALLDGSDVTKEEIVAARSFAERGERFFRDRGSHGGAKTLANVVAKAAKKMGDSEGFTNAQFRIGNYLELRADNTYGISRAVGLQEAQEHYARIGSSEDVERLKKEVTQSWEAARSQGEFQVREIEVQLPMEQTKERARGMLALGLDVALAQLAHDPEYSPVLDQIKETAREQGEMFPMTRLVTGITVEGSRQIHRAGSMEESEEAALRRQYTLHVQLMGMMLDSTFEVFRKEGNLDADTLAELLKRTGLVDDDQLPIIHRGFERYLGDDHVSALHILVPHLEDMIRRGVYHLGGTTTSSRSGVTTEKDLGQILETPELAAALGSDIIYFLKHLFTEQLGMNLRNRTGHGLIRNTDCNNSSTALVVHTFLRIASCEKLRLPNDTKEEADNC